MGILSVEKRIGVLVPSSCEVVLLLSCPSTATWGKAQMEENISLRLQRAVLSFGESQA